MRGQTIWGALFDNTAVFGAVPYMGLDGNYAVLYDDFFFRDSDGTLSVGCAGDFHQTEKVNVVGGFGSYLSINAQDLANNLLSQYKVSVSRGTGDAPTNAVTGDVVGQFAAYAYLGATPAYVPVGAIRFGILGGTAANPGGSAQLQLKSDAGTMASVLDFTPSSMAPNVDGAVSLGAAAKGFGKFYPESMGATAATAGAQTINKQAGKFIIAAGQQSVAVANSRVGANDIVLPVVMTDDATAKSVVITVTAGSFTAKLNAAATADTTIGFFVVNQA